MYELGIGWDSADERIGAASLWMVSTVKKGEAEASNGTRENKMSPLMAATASVFGL